MTDRAGAARLHRSLEDMTNREFIDGYLAPHAGKAEAEGWHLRSIVLREAIRRLSLSSIKPSRQSGEDQC